MRIGISGLSLHGYSKRGGFWEYFKTLLKIIEKVVQREKIFIFVQKELEKDFKEINKKNFHFIEVKIPEKGSHYTEFIFLPYYLKKYKIELLHFPTFAVPLFLKTPYIVTVHDLAFLKFEKNLKRRDVFYWKYVFKLSVKRAKMIISDSHNTKEDLNHYWKIPLQRIKVIPPFSSLLFSKSPLIKDEIVRKYGIKKPYYLFIGTLEPRKNLKRVIDAFLKLSREIEEVVLLIIGQKGWEGSELFRKIEENKQRIIWLNNITSEELPSFYKNAIALLYPSLYEGFGLPILEAYKFKVPVITSNVSSLPEVAGKGAIFVNPEDEGEIKRAMLEIYHNKDLRNRLLKAQEREIKKYDYKKIGEEILSIYEEVFLNSL